MLVVSDTSPLNYLVLVGAVEVLRSLFDEVVIPSAVLDELLHERALVPVRSFAQQLPAWIKVQSPAYIEPIVGLHRGETEAIALSKELTADALLVEERDARRVAGQRGIPVVGTLAVLAKAIAMDSLDLQETIERLRQTNFRGPIDLIEPLVLRYKAQ